MRFSALKVLTQGLTGNRGWRAHWRDPEPAEAYDIVIIGGGGHGLSTAYYLAKEHGLRRIAVLEKGYIGGGNIGRNTTIVSGQLLLAWELGILFAFPEALGRAGGGSQLQCYAFPAWANWPVSQRWAKGRGHSPCQFHPKPRR